MLSLPGGHIYISLKQIPLVTGGLDQKFCLIAEEMIKEIKNVEWVKVEGCGHAIHVEEPEKFGTIVSGFLRIFKMF